MSPPQTPTETRIEAGQVLSEMMFYAVRAGAAVHAGFVVVFSWYGWQALALVNIVSTLCYVASAVGMRDARRRWVMTTLAMVEIAAHAVIAVLSLGWETGFHLYLLTLVPIVYLGTCHTERTKTLTVLAMAAGYMLLRHVSHTVAPWYAVTEQAALWLETFNILTMLALLWLGAYMHYGALVQGERTLMRLADSDPLTGLDNRRRWLEQAETAQRRMQDEGIPFSVLMADVDHFKHINDRFGHGGGDEALRSISHALKNGLRGIDCVGRWGGEEFAILLTGARRMDAGRVAEELRQQVAGLDLRLRGGPAQLSITLGAAQAQPGETVQSVVQRADTALYRGKASGRNRVELAPHANAAVARAA